MSLRRWLAYWGVAIGPFAACSIPPVPDAVTEDASPSVDATTADVKTLPDSSPSDAGPSSEGEGLEASLFDSPTDDTAIADASHDASKGDASGVLDAANEAGGVDAGVMDAKPMDANTTDGPVCEDASAFPITFVQANAVNQGSSFSAPVVLQPPAVHDLLIVHIAFDQMGGTVSSVTDSAGNQFTRALGPNTELGDSDTYEATNYLYYAENVATAPAETVTVNLSSASQTFFEVYVLEYTGIATTNAFDVGSFNSQVGGTVMTSGFATTRSPHELIFGYGASDSASAGAGFTPRSSFDANVAEDTVVDCTGSYQTTADPGGNGWAMTMATFRGN